MLKDNNDRMIVVVYIVSLIMLLGIWVYSVYKDTFNESVSPSVEESVVSTVKKDITEGVIFDKYDYVSYSYNHYYEVYMIGFKGNNESGEACERYVKVTSVTYQSLNIGDKFDMHEHERK